MNDETSPSELALAPLVALAATPPPVRNPYQSYIDSLRASTSKDTMRRALSRVSGLIAGGAPPERVPWHELHYVYVTNLRAKLEAEGLKPRSINKILSAVRGVIDEARKLKMMDREEAALACEVDGFSVDDLPAGRNVERSESDMMIDACPNTLMGKRDKALVALLFGGGMRRAEAASVDVASIDRTTWEVKVRGKRSKERLVPIPPRAAVFVQQWLDARGSEPGPLLISFDVQGNVRRECGAYVRMSLTGVSHVFGVIAERGGVGNVTPHDARRTRATAMLSAGINITHVRDILGHEDIRTTARYDRSSDEAKRKSANLVDL